jgi:hypothetical protein
MASLAAFSRFMKYKPISSQKYFAYGKPVMN